MENQPIESTPSPAPITPINTNPPVLTAPKRTYVWTIAIGVAMAWILIPILGLLFLFMMAFNDSGAGMLTVLRMWLTMSSIALIIIVPILTGTLVVDRFMYKKNVLLKLIMFVVAAAIGLFVFVPIYMSVISFVAPELYQILQSSESRRDYPIKEVGGAVGIWQASPFMAAGWSTRYQFFESWKYNYRVSQMQCETYDMGHSGTWKLLSGGIIEITPVVNYVIVGDDLTCGPSGGWMGGEIKEESSQGSERYYMKVRECADGETNGYNCAKFDDIQFYQFSDDPTYENDSSLDKEPVF